MYPETNHRRRNVIIAIAVGLILSIGLIALLARAAHKKHTNTNQTAGTSTTQYDANSGDSVRTIKGENNSYGTTPGMPIFLGVNSLISHGVTSDQAGYMEQAFLFYSQKNHLNIQQVSITSNSVVTGFLNPGTDNQINYANFGVILDNKTKLTAQLQYSGIDTTELFLYNNGTQIFDSGLMPGS